MVPPRGLDQPPPAPGQRADIGVPPFHKFPPAEDPQRIFLPHSCRHGAGLSTQPKCVGFVWQGFGSGGATGVASVRSCQKLPLCLTEPMPAGSKTDPPLAKAKPISASVITYLRRRKTLRERELLQPERGVRRCKKLCRHQGQCRRRGRRMLQVPEQRSPCSPR